jgi:asparagine synthase (glutamine-hydrolysing)
MCGIVGIVDFTGRPIDARLLGRMCEAIRHRGPDDQGLVRFPLTPMDGQGRPSAALGSRRLSIIDVQGGHQPMANEDGTVWTVLNGEIYNFQELRRTLERQGHRFATRTDTEVLVHLYEERGEAFVSALDGMFALAIWDDRRGRLLLARDRFGKKPLFYSAIGSRVVFASELQALLLDPSISREADPEALDYYLTYMAIPAPLSIYRAVRKLPPASLLTHSRDGISIERYWALSYTPKRQLSEAEAGERVLGLLTEAVRKRLVSDVPLGAFLSGGVDSSAVTALMARLSDQPVRTFSIGFEEEDYTELPHARRVAERFGCRHEEFIVRPRAVEVLPKLVRHFGEPFADSSAIPSYYLSKLTREHVTVALNGDGGDETFAGYTRHLANRLAELWQHTPALVRGPVGWVGRRLPSRRADPRRWPARVERFLIASELPRAARYRRWVGVFTPDQKRELVGTPNGFPAEAGIVDRLFQGSGALDAVDAALAVDTAFYLPTDLLVKMDIATMANSLEARSPFLDHHLVEFAAQLPSHLKLRQLTSKYILKQALHGLVPPKNLRRGKRGFAVPIGRWFRGELRGFLTDHLAAARVARTGWVRQSAIARLMRDHLEGRRDVAHQLWSLLMLELWHREFIA